MPVKRCVKRSNCYGDDISNAIAIESFILYIIPLLNASFLNFDSIESLSSQEILIHFKFARARELFKHSALVKPSCHSRQTLLFH